MTLFVTHHLQSSSAMAAKVLIVLALALAAVMAEEGARDKKQAYVATFPGYGYAPAPLAYAAHGYAAPAYAAPAVAPVMTTYTAGAYPYGAYPYAGGAYPSYQYGARVIG